MNKIDKIHMLKDELLEVCEAWNLTTREKVIALQFCINNFEEKNTSKYPKLLPFYEDISFQQKDQANNKEISYI